MWPIELYLQFIGINVSATVSIIFSPCLKNETIALRHLHNSHTCMYIQILCPAKVKRKVFQSKGFWFVCDYVILIKPVNLVFGITGELKWRKTCHNLLGCVLLCAWLYSMFSVFLYNASKTPSLCPHMWTLYPLLQLRSSK